MSVKLNLLPDNLQVSKGIVKFVKTAKALSVIFLVVFIIFALGMLAFFVISRISLGNINSQVSQLESQVKALEGSEQQLILLKDRLSKISSITSMPSATENLLNFDSLLTDVSSDTKMSEINIIPTKIDTSFQFVSNQDFATFIGNLKNTEFFKSITLSSLNYSSENGYSVEAALNNK